jgi:hypothetical protein
VNATGYIVNAILVLLVIRQIRGGRLDLRNLVLPVVLVAAAAAYYLRTVDFFSDHGAVPAIARFSISRQITGSDAWVAALVMVALAEVIARLVVLRLRAHALPTASAAAPAPAYGQS